MQVVACLAPERQEPLRAATQRGHRLHLAMDWAHAESLVRRHPVDVLVADPTVGDLDGLRALRQRLRALPVVLYSPLDAAAAAAIAALGRDGAETLVLAAVDDEPEHLRRTLERQPGIALAAQLVSSIQSRLHTAPGPIAHAITRAIHTPAAFDGVPDLAAAADVSRRTIYRECERARLGSPREILAGARVLRAYAYLCELDYGIEDVTERLGYSSAHHLTKAMRWATGLTTARVRARVTPAEMVAYVAARLMPEAGAAGTGAAADVP